MKRTVRELDEGQLGFMWSMLQLGKQESNIPVLKDTLDKLRQALIQKSAGQRVGDPREYVDFADLGTLVNIVVVESLCLYLSGDLDKLERLKKQEET